MYSPPDNPLIQFSTTSETFHGHPDEISCPENRTRRSIALYYFSSGRPKSESEERHGTKFVSVKGEKFESENNFSFKGFIAEWFLSAGMKKVLRKLLRKFN